MPSNKRCSYHSLLLRHSVSCSFVPPYPHMTLTILWVTFLCFFFPLSSSGVADESLQWIICLNLTLSYASSSLTPTNFKPSFITTITFCSTSRLSASVCVIPPLYMNLNILVSVTGRLNQFVFWLFLFLFFQPTMSSRQPGCPWIRRLVVKSQSTAADISRYPRASYQIKKCCAINFWMVKLLVNLCHQYMN